MRRLLCNNMQPFRPRIHEVDEINDVFQLIENRVIIDIDINIVVINGFFIGILIFRNKVKSQHKLDKVILDTV